MTNLDRMRKDIDRLTSEGNQLLLRMVFDLFPNEVTKARGKEKDELKKLLPAFNENYQRWYSEALAMLSVVLPDRVADFKAYYQLPKPPKELVSTTYTISDYLRGTTVTIGYDKRLIVGPNSAQTPMQQQVEIVRAAAARFESSLFDIKALTQADLFENELEAAAALNKAGFTRGAGAIAGVVLEGHLETVCNNHSIKITKKKPTLSDVYEVLKAKNIVDQKTWRFVQHLGDIRNACDHKGDEPSRETVSDLIEGVRKISKTVF
jgi:hypothetical protein